MNYYLGDIYVTHRRFLWRWVEYTAKLSTILIHASDLDEANKKGAIWHGERIKELKGKYKTVHFVTPSI